MRQAAALANQMHPYLVKIFRAVGFIEKKGADGLHFVMSIILQYHPPGILRTSLNIRQPTAFFIILHKTIHVALSIRLQL